MAFHITTPVSAGELFDKISILEIKLQRIPDPQKLQNIRTELAVLQQSLSAHIHLTPELEQQMTELKGINETLWEIEDAIRECERKKDFGPRFIELARSVYKNNDQ